MNCFRYDDQRLRTAFLSFDSINYSFFKKKYKQLSKSQMISEVDENMSGSIDFGEFIKVVEKQKERADHFDDEDDMLDAFVACGGQADKGGHVKRDTLVKIIKHDFGLTIDIEDLINKIDTDGSGEIEFDEFKILLSNE